MKQNRDPVWCLGFFCIETFCTFLPSLQWFSSLHLWSFQLRAHTHTHTHMCAHTHTQTRTHTYSPRRSTSAWKAFDTRHCRRQCKARQGRLESEGEEPRPCHTRSCRQTRTHTELATPLTCSAVRSHQHVNNISPLSADVLRGDGVTADSRHLNMSDLLHLQTQVLPLNRHPCPPLSRTCERVNLWERSITDQFWCWITLNWMYCKSSNSGGM